MTTEKLKVTDHIICGFNAGTQSGEQAKATGVYYVECHDKDGKLKWSADSKNLVVNAGLAYMAGTALTSVTQITTWYLGLYGAAASNTPAAGDTMASHAGWTDITGYSNATRPAFSPASSTAGSSTNSASPAVFNINASNTIAGCFITTSSTVGGTAGILFSAADFASSRAVLSGDTLTVTYTVSC